MILWIHVNSPLRADVLDQGRAQPEETVTLAFFTRKSLHDLDHVIWEAILLSPGRCLHLIVRMTILKEFVLRQEIHVSKYPHIHLRIEESPRNLSGSIAV